MPQSRNRPRPTSRQRSRLAQRLAQGLRRRGWTTGISRTIRGMASPRPGSRRWRRYCRRVQAMFRRIPEGMSDADALAYAERVNPAGTTWGWMLTEHPEDIPASEGGGTTQRAACAQRPGCVHLRVNA